MGSGGKTETHKTWETIWGILGSVSICLCVPGPLSGSSCWGSPACDACRSGYLRGASPRRRGACSIGARPCAHVNTVVLSRACPSTGGIFKHSQHIIGG
eukprot:5248807-Pyramimonas_sp.AAC.1